MWLFLREGGEMVLIEHARAERSGNELTVGCSSHHGIEGGASVRARGESQWAVNDR